MKRRRVAITGCGVVSALGMSRSELFDSLESGRCAVRTMPEWRKELGTEVLAAPVALAPGAERAIDRKMRRSMGRAALFAALAAKQAVSESGLSAQELCSGRCGCVISSTMGSSSSIVEATELLLTGRREEMPAQQFFKCVSHSSAFNVANYLGICGVLLSPCSACASGAQSIGEGAELIAFGRQEMVVAGGSDEVTPAVAGSFSQLFALAEGEGVAPEKASRPFDAARSGLVCGEGAGVVVLEELEHARSRGAHILGEIVAYATNCGGEHVSQSDRGAIARCIRTALAEAGTAAEAVDYVSAHATATIAGDREDAAALLGVFGAGTPVAGLKGQLGHTLGASGAIELAALLEMIRRHRMLPTRNLDEVAADCAGLNHLREVVDGGIGLALKISVAFGGVNAVLGVRGFTE